MMQEIIHPLTGDRVFKGVHPSGLTVFVWPRKEARSVYAVFATRYGSVNNTLPAPDGTETVPAGIAHYLEHKLFESEDGDAFARFAATGASANAYTSFDRTAYLFQATENIRPSLDILLDFVRQPYFTEETVRTEQGIIGQEIRMGEDNPGHRLLFDMLGGMYHDHPVRLDIAGTVESIADITPELLYRCYNEYYAPDNMALSVAGHITPEEVWDAVDKAFAARPAPAHPPRPVPVFPAEEPAGIVTDRVESAMAVAAPLFYLGYKAPYRPATPADRAGAAILDELIAGRTGPLYERLMAQGLINPGFGSENFDGPGYNVWLFGGESADPERAAALIREEICRLQKEGIDGKLLDILRRGVYGRTVAGFDDPENCAEYLLDDWLYGFSPVEDLTALAALTPADVERQLREQFPADRSTLCIIRPQA